MQRTLVLLASLVIAASATAERVDRSIEDLGKAATDIFIARVDEVAVTPERDGDWLYLWHVLTTTVEIVEKGDLAKGSTATVRAWRKSWKGGGNPPPDGYGVRGIPEQGDVVRIYAARRPDGSLAVVEPNGLLPPHGAPPLEVRFAGAGGFELRGTMLVPAMSPAKRPALVATPAVLLLPGSGPTDRDGNQKPAMVTDVLSQIAERLQADGVATLRFDKRACPGYMAQWPRELPALNAFFAYQLFIDDVIAAYRFMRSQPGIDPARCAILGHSEGGLFALQAAADLAGSPEQPAGIACVATPGRTMDHLVREQIAFDLRVKRAPQPTFDAFMAAVDRGIASVKADRKVPDDMPAGLKALFNPTAAELLYAYFTVNPRVLAAKVRGPVLVLNGDNDVQVSAELDAKGLASALETREPTQPSTLVIVEGMSHNLKETASTADPGFAGPVVAPALEAIAAWARSLSAVP